MEPSLEAVSGSRISRTVKSIVILFNIMPFQLLACGKLTKQVSSEQLTYSLPIVHKHVTAHEGNKKLYSWICSHHDIT
jgi:hypothetical protein